MPLCEILLQLPKFSKPFLTVSSFEVFESLFGSDSISFDGEKFEEILKVGLHGSCTLQLILLRVVNLKCVVFTDV